jgi:NAD(P)-dependent dehydrogenase (short-subunit alcohol dehydrogenase family)
MAVNLRAPFLCTQQAARLMRRSPRPDGQSAVVVNLADLSGLVPWSGYAHHGVSRAGLLQLTQATARELAPAIRVNAVVAGPILPPPGLDGAGEPWQRILRRVPLGRAGRPDEVAQAVVFLATNAFTTGAILMVDGGEHLRLARRDAPD